ncbi:unannotated protein [freshwater metagenome]|uniref:Unannotated protein n=1 Tax=freshwater metagenome TaxID=449393 RepID=A0A6J6MIS0_9ZZZZ|nr:hypothetical protein [Actinomycetota bacterium]
MAQKKITSNTSSGGRAQQRLRIAAALLGIGGLVFAVFLGIYVTAIGTVGKSFLGEPTDSINFMIQGVKLVEGQYAAFNWLIFLLAYAPFLISSAILFSGAEVCGAVARRTRTRSSSSSPEPDGAPAL